MLNYLKQEEFNAKSNIFDIGWRGSIQQSLKNLTNYDITGYYLCHDLIGFYSDIKAFAFITNENSIRFINNIKMIFELLFSAPHGTLISFKESKNKIEPVCNDFIPDTLEAIQKFQDGAFEIFKTMLKRVDLIDFSNHDLFVMDLFEMIVKRNFVDVYNFSTISNTIGAGDTDDQKPYAKIYPIKEFIKDPNKIIIDARALLWTDSALIKAEDGRIFTIEEIRKIHNIPIDNQIIIEHKSVSLPERIYRFYKANGLLATIKKIFSKIFS